MKYRMKKTIIISTVTGIITTLIMILLLTGCNDKYLDSEMQKDTMRTVALNYKALYETERENVSVLREINKQLKTDILTLTRDVDSMWSYINWLDGIMENKYRFEYHNELYLRTN